MDVLLDTNLLARSMQISHLLHQTAVHAIKELSTRGDRVLLVPQVIYEYFVVCTRPPAEYGGLGMTNSAALSEITRITSLVELLPDSPDIYTRWIELLNEHQIVGKRAHDTRLVAAMNVHGIARIATFNARDFQRFDGVEVIAPEELAKSWIARAVV